jgi:GNAT superfamily N-acetyltransferase
LEFEPTCRFEPARHDVTAFDCGSDAQTNWLRRVAAVAHAAKTAVVYVVTPTDEDRVVGYYALAAASVAHADAPERLTKGAGRSPIPVILLARLGVDATAQGHGVGAALVKDAMIRAHQAAGAIGARALLVHAESDEARSFYEHLAEFDPSPSDPLHLLLLMTDIEAILGPAAAAASATPIQGTARVSPGRAIRGIRSRRPG